MALFNSHQQPNRHSLSERDAHVESRLGEIGELHYTAASFRMIWIESLRFQATSARQLAAESRPASDGELRGRFVEDVTCQPLKSRRKLIH